MIVKQEVRSALVKIIQEQTKMEEAEFTHLESFEGIIDSLTLLEIVCEIEDNFDLEIDDEQIPQFRSFDDVVQLVSTMVQASP
ncbi:MAG: acyl carrier protein [Anaerolineae bacterium]|nr:acyl carrier protein [Anaerolineae bacterium]